MRSGKDQESISDWTDWANTGEEETLDLKRRSYWWLRPIVTLRMFCREENFTTDVGDAPCCHEESAGSTGAEPRWQSQKRNAALWKNKCVDGFIQKDKKKCWSEFILSMISICHRRESGSYTGTSQALIKHEQKAENPFLWNDPQRIHMDFRAILDNQKIGTKKKEAAAAIIKNIDVFTAVQGCGIKREYGKSLFENTIKMSLANQDST